MKKQKSKPTPKLITISEASQLLNCHPNTLRHWDKDGTLKAIRIGRKIRKYKKDEILNIINNNRKPEKISPYEKQPTQNKLNQQKNTNLSTSSHGKNHKLNTLRESGLKILGDIPWGTHFCQFYQTKEDLLDILVPYFTSGLKNNEFCMWITSEPLEVNGAKQALKKKVPELEHYIKNRQIEILDYTQWYTKEGRFESKKVLSGWVKKLNLALKKGYSGLRLTGNTFWLEKKDWKDFTEYEAVVNDVIGKYKMLAVCTYSIDKCGINEIADVISNHKFAVIKRGKKWSIIESSEQKKIEENLQKSEKMFFDLYSSMTEGVAFHDVVYNSSGKAVDYKITNVNPSYERITGLSKDKVIGKKASIIYGTGKPPYLNIYSKVASSEKPTSFETFFPPMNKYFSISVFSHTKGKFNTVFYDITESKKTEEALRNSESQLKSAQRIAKVGSWELDLITNKLTWSDEAFRIFEIDKNKFGASYETFLNLIHPDDRKIVDKAYTDSIKTKIPYDIVHRLKFQNGYIKYVREICETYFDKDGKPIKSVGSVQDITEQINIEKELNRLASFPRLNPNPIIEISMQGKIVYVNPEMIKLFPDIAKAEAEHPLLTGFDPNSIKKNTHPLKREMQVENKWYYQTITYVPETDSIRIYNIDITERKKLEYQKDEFLNIVSHELKTPLTSIKAYIQILKKRMNKDKTSSYFASQIDAHTDKITSLVNDLLDIGKIGAGKLTINKKKIKINNLLEKITTDFQYTTDSHVIIKKSKTDKDITGDEDRLSQVLINLISNAVKYSTKGDKILINIEENNKDIIVSIKDFGIGISKKDLPYVFNRYFRAKEDKRGFGLGLYISSEIIKQHGGKMWVESKVGKGSTFYFSLPLN